MSQCLANSILKAGSLRHLSLLIVAAALPLADVSAATLRFDTGSGVVVVNVEDPNIRVALDDGQLKISGAGTEEVRIATGLPIFAAGGSHEILTIARERRVLVQVRAESREESALGPSREEAAQLARQTATKLVNMRSALDRLVWKDVQSRWTTTEAAKLLIAFFRGDGSVPGFRGTTEEARKLREGLAELRKERVSAFAMLSVVSRIDAARPVSPLCGEWKVVDVQGAGGVAADALELYEPDPVGRYFVATNDSAGLLTGAGFWLFDASYDDGGDGGEIDLKAVARGNTIYRGRYRVRNQEATLSVSPMNQTRPRSADGKPTDGGFVLRLRKCEPPLNQELFSPVLVPPFEYVY